MTSSLPMYRWPLAQLVIPYWDITFHIAVGKRTKSWYPSQSHAFRLLSKSINHSGLLILTSRN